MPDRLSELMEQLGSSDLRIVAGARHAGDGMVTQAQRRGEVVHIESVPEAGSDTFLDDYEARFAAIAGARFAVAFGYARQGLRAALTAGGLTPGDGVILSPLTCKVVPLALLSVKLRPVYTDISERTLNLDPDRVERESRRPGVRAVLFQHTYGNIEGADGVAQVATGRHLLMFEDCAQCLPVAWDGRYPGQWGLAGVFSNNLLKPLPAGSGGIAITNNIEIARKIKQAQSDLPMPGRFRESLLRLEVAMHDRLLRPSLYWGFLAVYTSVSGSYRARPIEREISAEVTAKAWRPGDYQVRRGLKSLSTLERVARHRQLCCEQYAQSLAGASQLEFAGPAAPGPLYYYPVLADNKQELLRIARDKRIELIAWPRRTPIYPIEREQELRAYGYEPGTCPVAERVASRLIGLPTHIKITERDRRRIVELLGGTARF